MSSVRVAARPLQLPEGGRVRKIESTDGTRLHVQIFGADDAPTIVLAHGITQAGRAFAYQVLDLADRYRVVVYDQRGHGASMLPRELDRFRVSSLADDLQAVLQGVLRDGERAVVGGHSLGGITIMAWAGRYPDEVRRRAAAAVLINTAPGGILDHVAVIGVPRRLHGTARILIRAGCCSWRVREPGPRCGGWRSATWPNRRTSRRCRRWPGGCRPAACTRWPTT